LHDINQQICLKTVVLLKKLKKGSKKRMVKDHFKKRFDLEILLCFERLYA
jgi:hypothetical protein